MKNLGKITLLSVIVLLVVLALAGCSTPTTICEFDKDGKITRKTVTERDIFDKITDSLKNKTVVAWSDGWVAYIQATIATTEEPLPIVKIFAGKVAKGYMSVLPGQANIENISKIIQATKSNTEIKTTGITDKK